VHAAGWHREEVQDGDLGLIASPLDFLGINYYCRHLVRSPCLPGLSSTDGREQTGMGWEVYPEGSPRGAGVRRVENRRPPALRHGERRGLSPRRARSHERSPASSFLERHFEAALTAIERGLPLRGYFVWSLLDNFEWPHAYSYRFGIVHVDFDTLARRVRDSAKLVSRVARDGLP
jgi:beta-glucosidase